MCFAVKRVNLNRILRLVEVRQASGGGGSTGTRPDQNVSAFTSNFMFRNLPGSNSDAPQQLKALEATSTEHLMSLEKKRV